MAEISEVFEDLGDNAKKLFKSKPFIILAIGVALIALFVNFNKGRSSSSSSEETVEEVSYYDGTHAIGYAGYPGMYGSSGDSGQYDWYLQEIMKMQDEYDENIEALQGEYETSLGEMQSQYDTALEGFNKSLEDMQNEYDKSLEELLAAKSSGSSSGSRRPSSSASSTDDLMEQWKLQQEYEADLAQMKANSELYNALGDGQSETKKALHQQNLEIASKYGFNYDSQSGNYFTNSGSVVYLTSQQQAKALTGKTTRETSSSTVTFDPNVDYQARINHAVASGASQSTINQLQAQRQAKINAVYGGKDPGKSS